MKKSSLLIFVGVVVGLICCYHEWLVIRMVVSARPTKDNQGFNIQKEIAEKPASRESITFILGEDKEEDNRYYEEATYYYTYHPQGQTDYLVSNCRSLLEVRDYLESNRPCNTLPWGLINLVSHGNQWNGMSVKLSVGGKRTTAARIEEYIDNKKFLPLPDTILDQQTEILIHGCGIGNNQSLVNAMARAFGRDGARPVVRASRLFEYYASVRFQNTVQTERYLATPYFITFKMGEVPSTDKLLKALREKYPDAAVDWRSALSRKKPRRVGDVYHHTFEVPVKWIIPVNSDSLPDLLTKKSQLAWLRKQKEIDDELSALQIQFDTFNWSLTKVYVNHNAGDKVPAFWVKGYCTVLTVLQALTQDSDQAFLQKPLTPDPDDGLYYYSTALQKKL